MCCDDIKLWNSFGQVIPVLDANTIIQIGKNDLFKNKKSDHIFCLRNYQWPDKSRKNN